MSAISKIAFTCTALQGTGKKGVLPKDENGYYTMPLGALNVFNSAGEYYTLDGARDLFESSSSLMRRVKAGVLSGEMGHPKPLPGQDLDSYSQRICTLEETRISHHISEVWLDFDSVKDADGKTVIAIMGNVKPAGPFGPALEDSFQNPKINTCFSIRAFTHDDWVAGTKHRVLKQIVTWDAVQESGLAIARKYNAPSLESFQEQLFEKKNFMKMLNTENEAIATESTRVFGLELFQNLGWNLNENNQPGWKGW
jgi:hypothetical protein